MSKIHLVLEYQEEKNKALVLFVNNITDYAYKSSDFLNICNEIKSVFQNEEVEKPEDLCNLLKQKIMEKISEKTIEVTYIIYVAMNGIVCYKHRYPHGKNNDFICEKVLLIEAEKEVSLERSEILDLAVILLPINFKYKKDDKHADNILMYNEDSIFYSDEFVSSEEYELLSKQKQEAIKLCQQQLKICILNVLCLN